MFFDSFFEKYIHNKWLRLNFQAIIVGLLIGAILNVLNNIISNNWRTDRVIITFLVSYMITMSITNTIALSQAITLKKFKKKWNEPAIYYLALLVGMLIGTELTFFFISLLYGKPFQLFTHINDLKFNLFMAIIVGTIVYVNSVQKDKYELELKESEFKLAKLNQLKTNAELQALQSKINPHFLYNALNSITSLIHDMPNEAEEMTIKLSKLFRYSLNTQEVNFATLAEEVEIVKLYLDIEKIRFQHKLLINIDVPADLQAIKIPRFLIQPLIENAIKHGINKLKEGGEISLTCKLIEEKLHISIHDNGPKFDTEYQAGYGLQSTFDKLNLLYADLFEVNINNGTYKEVLIILPLNNEV
jgi:LytS/YehU family sensor histidine kinase